MAAACLCAADLGKVCFLMAIKAELRAFFGQQLGLVRLMRHVTGSAFTIAGWIVFKRRFGDALLQVVVTIVTELADIFYRATS